MPISQELAVKALSCSRNDQPLFLPVTFKLRAGDIIHIKGPNGIGKTTLLRCLAGLCEPAKGEITWCNEQASENEDYKKLLRFFGHKLGLKSLLSVEENLKWSGSSSVLPGKIELEKVLECYELLNLKKRLVSSLSSGQKQRVALASLALSKSILWLLDEPFNSLDQRQCNRLMEAFQKHLANGGMILFSAHQSVPQGLSYKVLELIPCSAEV